MKFLYQFGIGLGLALASSLLVCGALLMASAEGISQATATPEPTLIAASVGPGMDTSTPRPSATPLPPTACPPPNGWVTYVITSDDTLDSIAQAANVPTQELISANCLLSTALLPGTILYIPPQPTLTPTIAPVSPADTQQPTSTIARATPLVCPNPPSGWVHYIIKQHDTLYSISQTYKVSMAQLQRVNCISDPNSIRYGMNIFVPNTVVAAPTQTPAPTSTNKPAPTRTRTTAPTFTTAPTNIPSHTPSSPATHTPSSPATHTPSSPATNTPSSPATNTPSIPATNTPLPIAT